MLSDIIPCKHDITGQTTNTKGQLPYTYCNCCKYSEICNYYSKLPPRDNIINESTTWICREPKGIPTISELGKSKRIESNLFGYYYSPQESISNGCVTSDDKKVTFNINDKNCELWLSVNSYDNDDFNIKSNGIDLYLDIPRGLSEITFISCKSEPGNTGSYNNTEKLIINVSAYGGWLDGINSYELILHLDWNNVIAYLEFINKEGKVLRRSKPCSLKNI